MVPYHNSSHPTLESDRPKRGVVEVESLKRRIPFGKSETKKVNILPLQYPGGSITTKFLIDNNVCCANVTTCIVRELLLFMIIIIISLTVPEFLGSFRNQVRGSSVHLLPDWDTSLPQPRARERNMCDDLFKNIKLVLKITSFTTENVK